MYTTYISYIYIYDMCVCIKMFKNTQVANYKTKAQIMLLQSS